MPRYTHPKLVLLTIMLVSFLGSAGIALPYPILSPYFMSGVDDPLIHFMGLDPKILLGISLAAYPFGLLIGSNIIGSLSDRYGRKPILVITLIASVVGYILTGLAIHYSSFVWFIITRMVTGFCEGNVSIARAIATELHPHIDRKRAIALLFSTIYAGWMIGPLAGGYLMPFGVDFAFYASSLAVLLSLFMVLFVLPSQPPQKTSILPFFQEIRANHSIKFLKIPALKVFFLYYFIYSLGTNAFYEFYPLWLVEVLLFNSLDIAWTTLLLTSGMLIISIWFAGKIANVLGDKNTVLSGHILLASAIAITTFLDEPWVFFSLLLAGATIPVINVTFTAMLSQNFGQLGEGKMMGLQITIFYFSNLLIALIGGVISMISAAATLWLSAALVLFSITIFKEPKPIGNKPTTEYE